MRSWIVAAIMIASARGFAGMCPPRDPVVSILTPADLELPADGGIVIGTEPTGGLSGTPAGPLKFHDVNAELDPVIHAIAPGLDLYQAPAASGPELQLGGTHFKRQTGKAPDVLAAPIVTRVERIDDNSPNRSHLEVRATLKIGAPATALALVVFGVAKAGNTPRSWVRVTPGATTLAVYGSAPKCSAEAPGTILSAAGDRVAFAWVDQTGRLSKLSATVTIAQGKR